MVTNKTDDCLNIFTYHTVADRRLYIITSTDAPPGTVQHRTCPVGVVRDQLGTVRCLADFTRKKHKTFLRAML